MYVVKGGGFRQMQILYLSIQYFITCIVIIFYQIFVHYKLT